MLLHPKGAKKRGKEEQKATEQYERGNEVPSTLKQQSSLGNDTKANPSNVTYSGPSKIRGVLGAPGTGIHSNQQAVKFPTPPHLCPTTQEFDVLVTPLLSLRSTLKQTKNHPWDREGKPIPTTQPGVSSLTAEQTYGDRR